MTSPGVYTRSGLPVEITAEFENWRRVRDFRRRRGLGLSFAVSSGSPHRRDHHEEQGRPRAALRARRCDQRCRRPPAGRRRCPGQTLARRAGAVLPAMVSMAGSNSSGCGASTPTKRWIDAKRHSGRCAASNPESSRFPGFARFHSLPRNDGQKSSSRKLSASCAAARPCRRGRSHSLRAPQASSATPDAGPNVDQFVVVSR